IYTVLFSVICSILLTLAHEVNKYKYFCLDVEENPYGIEKRFREEFKKLGFSIINQAEFDNLDNQQKSLTLFADYDYFINYNGNSSLSIILKNDKEATIWSQTGYGSTFLSPTGDIKKCTKQIMRSFGKLKYKFDETRINEKPDTLPFNNWTEDSVKIYLQNKKPIHVEGIYKNYANHESSLNIAIIKDNNTYYGIVLNSDNELWREGELKIILNLIEGNLYDVEFYDFDHRKYNAIAEFRDDRLLEFNLTYNGETTAFSYLKVFPSGTDSTIDSTTMNNKNCKATGSGVLISDNVIITNYHVIEGAEKVDAIINIEGVPETFNAKVLCSDKTNDLAIVCIKDERFKGQGTVPFKILSNTVDVGTSVFSMGFPLTTFLGDEVKITDGIISSKTGFDGDVVTYQISAPIQPGNSGGALFDKNGNLVGITSAGLDKSIAENVGYAIKSPYVLNIIDSAPVSISIPKGTTLPKENLPELIKILKPYVVYLKIY
ncbi:MAG: S1C family serine protease, partial [Muribaculaceae bacterium]|nr:S1C family serine protease [Muribaculaceae bacterium]